MLSITVELIHGTIRAASADDLALTGVSDPGDWPPNPARLFSALVAADGTRDRCRLTDASELRTLERAAPPRIFATPRAGVLESNLTPRYVVENAREQGTVQEYPARKAGLVRPGTRLCPLSSRIVYVWEDLDPSPDELRGIEIRAARVGYLGCADTPVRIRVGASLPEGCTPDLLWEPDPSGVEFVPIPVPGLLEILDNAYDRFTAGEPVRRAQFRSERARYRSPDQPAAPPAPRWAAVRWLRFGEPVPGRFLLRVTETLKAAVMDHYERHVGPVPAVLHGHGFEGTAGYRLVHWLGLPEAGYPYARGRLHGAAVALPTGVPAEVVAGVDEALWRLRELVLPGRPPIRVRRFSGEARPWSANPRRWQGKARRWVSVSPVVQERRAKRGLQLDDVARWCEHAGLPAPRWFRVSPVPLVPGGLALRPHQVFHHQEDKRPYAHLEVAFSEEVEGPVVLGRARHLGIGLMAPVCDGKVEDR